MTYLHLVGRCSNERLNSELTRKRDGYVRKDTLTMLIRLAKCHTCIEDCTKSVPVLAQDCVTGTAPSEVRYAAKLL